jgi:hypothetical protein
MGCPLHCCLQSIMHTWTMHPCMANLHDNALMLHGDLATACCHEADAKHSIALRTMNELLLHVPWCLGCAVCGMGE